MNNQEKILLSAYLDGNLDPEEKKFIDKLLEEDKEALKYLNNLKIINNKVNGFFESSLQSNEAKETVAFAQKLGSKRNSPLIFLKNFFIPQAVLGYALSGFIFFNVGTGSFASNDMEEFNYDEPYQYVHLKLRGANEDKTNQYIQEALNEMLIEKKGTAKISYGQKEITITLTNSAFKQDEHECFNGSVKTETRTDNFLFCKSATSKESSLLFE